MDAVTTQRCPLDAFALAGIAGLSLALAARLGEWVAPDVLPLGVLGTVQSLGLFVGAVAGGVHGVGRLGARARFSFRNPVRAPGETLWARLDWRGQDRLGTGTVRLALGPEHMEVRAWRRSAVGVAFALVVLVNLAILPHESPGIVVALGLAWAALVLCDRRTRLRVPFSQVAGVFHDGRHVVVEPRDAASLPAFLLTMPRTAVARFVAALPAGLAEPWADDGRSPSDPPLSVFAGS